MKTHIAYCGLECAQCPAFIHTANKNQEGLNKLAKEWSSSEMPFSPEDLQCYGCRQNKKIFTWCNSCDVRTCAIEKNVENCAYCDSYPCEKIEMPHSKSPDAKTRLDAIYQELTQR